VKILVFMKQVADTEARILISGDQKSLEIENKYNINFFDEFAIEAGIRIREKDKESQVIVCSVGTKKAIEALRTAIAMGADKAFLLDNSNIAADDSLALARVLAAFAQRESFDLILCGRQAIDDENANIGVMVAEFLGIPHVSAISKLEAPGGGKVVVERELDGDRETLEVDLPALLTTQKGLNEPRVPLITGVMKAMKAVIPAEDPLLLGIPADQIGPSSSRVTLIRYESPAGRPPVKIIEGETPEEKVRGLIRALKEDAKVL
jgi:electron transfer flavoprotein beta subunit